MGNYYRNSTFFVATDGCDSNDGIHKPFATLHRALDEIRALREAGVPQPFTVRIHGGEYFLDKPLMFDAGCDQMDIQAYGDGEVILSGGRRLEGFTWGEVNGVKCFVLDMPEVREGKFFFTDLFVNDRRAAKTRYPEEGNLWMESVEYMGTDRVHGPKSGSKWFIAKEGDIGNFKNITDVTVSLTHLWVDEHSLIKAYDPETRRVDLHYRTNYRIDRESGSNRCADYWLENVFEMLKKPGQWYLDRADGKLYYIPFNTETPENCVFYAPVLHKFAILRGDRKSGKPVRGIRFKNLTFTCSGSDYLPEIYHMAKTDKPGTVNGYEPLAAWRQGANGVVGVLDVREAEHIAVENCVLKHFGWYGISFWDGCVGCSVTGCDICDGGAGGVNITGADAQGLAEYISRSIRVTDNTIRHCGRRYMTASGVLVQHGRDIEISHNDIYDLYYTGVAAGWVWGYEPSVTCNIRIEKNHIYDLGQGLLSDMGGVYLLSKQPGTVVCGNLIHDIRRKYYGGWALYTDEGSSGIIMENNVCYDTSSNSYHQHYGCGNIIRNNIFAFSDDPLLAVTRPEAHLSIVFENNILYSAGAAVYSLRDEHFLEGKFASNRNLVWDTTRDTPIFLDRTGREPREDMGRLLQLENMHTYGLDEDTVIADPLFENAEGRNFTLKPESPAFQLGFHPIDLSDVGPRK